MSACAHSLTPEQESIVRGGNCAELLRAADAARAEDRGSVASTLASSCSQQALNALVMGAADPAQALLWCGRAKAAQATVSCDTATIAALASQLHPRLTIGPPEPGTMPIPELAAALEELGPKYDLAWRSEDPDVVVGRLVITIEHLTTSIVTSVPDSTGAQQRVAATQHRFVARAEAEVELGGRTRVLRATEEARDVTWPAAPQISVAAKFDPQVPPEAELKKRAALSWMKTLVKALAAAPPEAVDVSDARGCVAYGLSLNLLSGDPAAAANGLGDPAKVNACEKILGEPPGAGIPVP
ncbi:MAG TPA: hypothetical protein VG496_18790 [Myxococcales bacterium]|nr:hypothetical protein [Myxococcales bacterium]